jgi:hypothetical protein
MRRRVFWNLRKRKETKLGVFFGTCERERKQSWAPVTHAQCCETRNGEEEVKRNQNLRYAVKVQHKIFTPMYTGYKLENAGEIILSDNSHRQYPQTT